MWRGVFGVTAVQTRWSYLSIRADSQTDNNNDYSDNMLSTRVYLAHLPQEIDTLCSGVDRYFKKP